MRINTNIPALNTYRQLTSANNAQAKSMEKLSSGLRINSAADDAAGLAISEKMRGQIRGLDQAQNNAQDGISMIQTSEGALNETQSILQRMRELATQASNDTNTESDRGEIQKEMNQLTSEINRIGNTTEFNTQKLLDGGREVTANAAISADNLTGGKDVAAVNAVATEDSTGVDAVASEISGVIGGSNSFTINAGTANGSAGDITIAFTNSTSATESATFNGTGDTLTINLDDATSYSASDIQGYIQSADGDSNKPSELDMTQFTVTPDGTDTIAGSSATESLLLAGGQDASTANGDITFTDIPEEGSTITIADQTISFFDSSAGNYADATEAKSALGSDFAVDIDGLADGDAVAQAVEDNVTIANYTLDATGSGGQLDVDADNTGAFDGTTFLSTDDAIATAASGDITFSDTPTEGSSVTIGSETIGFYDSSLGNYADDTEATSGLGTDFAINTNGLDADGIRDAVIALDDSLSATVALSSDGSGKVSIDADSTGSTGNSVALGVSEDSTTGFDASFQIGANTGQSLTINVADMRSEALDVSSTDQTAAKTVTVNGENYNVKWNDGQDVTNGTDSTGVEYALDVSTSDNATAAIAVLDEAINSVSSERSKLGAYQNRLDYTVNNLTTSSENLTAAESRIRDVDMAKEMMNQTKSSILSQAAQAMLAQANQQPQGVLQLLR